MSEPSILRVTIAEDPPARLDKALARDVPEAASLSRSRLAKLIEAGAVTRGGVALGPREKVAEGDVIEDREELRILKKLGVQLSPIQLPDSLPVWAMTLVLNTEAATVFDELNRNNVTEGLNTWPNSFRQGAFLSAVDYLRANRLRTMLMKEMETLMSGIDCYVGGDDLAITNLTGHPTVVSPNGFEQGDGVRTPNAITFTGRLFGESSLLAVADAYQQATGFHREHPTLG